MRLHRSKAAVATLVIGAFTMLAGIVAPALRAGDDAAAPFAGSKAAAQAKRTLDRELQLLNTNGIAADTDSILDFLRRRHRTAAQRQRELDTLIGQLASRRYPVRKAATRKLLTLGPAAEARLVQAAKSKDPETAYRAAMILKRLNSGDRHALVQRSLVLAALQVLKNRAEAKAVPVLLQTIPGLDDPILTDAAFEAVWASTNATHAMLLRKALSNDKRNVAVAAIVALELARGKDAVPTLTPYLRCKSALLRLAAARALVDRKPREAVAALVKLVADDNEEIAWQAGALLQMLSGRRMELSAELTPATAWQTWSVRDLPTARLNVPLGRRRLDLSAGRYSLHETFSRKARSLAGGYGVFRYSSTNGGTARVVAGRLLIGGANNEVDQRVSVTSARMIGRTQWPRVVEVRARLGGKQGNNLGWHVGVSVGRVKVLFHPGLSGGSCRAETTDTHHAFFNNHNMGFTPATDRVHEMLLSVKKLRDGAEFRITVRDAGSKAAFHRRFTVSGRQLGKFNRIGLERSGRPGGDAMFDAVSIQLKR